MRPADPSRGNGWLLYDVVNRGMERVLSRVNGVAVARRPGTGDDAGDGLLMREGFTFVWSGWQPDLPQTADYLTACYPIATRDGVPVTDMSREEWLDTGTADPFHPPLTYPAADTDPAKATLTVRQHERDARSTPEDLAWSYAGEKTLRINRPAGFDSGAIYEFIYPATNSPVSGMAFAAVRDLVSLLRFEDHDSAGIENPLAANGARPRRAMLFGVSQSGRFARDFLLQGYNQDRQGRQLFDAAVVVVAGSRKTWVNSRFVQPGRFSRQHEDHSFPGDQFPFAYAPVHDPIIGVTDDILRRCREQGAVPHLIHFDSEAANNYNGYENPAVDTLLREALTEQDTERRIQLYQQAEQIILDDVPWFPLFFDRYHILVKKYVKFYPVPGGIVPRLRFVVLGDEPVDE